MRLPFGKYKGWHISQVPDDYITWLMDDPRIWETTRAAANREWYRRHPDVIVVEEKIMFEIPPDLNKQAKELILAGYRSMVKKYHPDAGGDEEEMKKINLVMELFNPLIGRS